MKNSGRPLLGILEWVRPGEEDPEPPIRFSRRSRGDPLLTTLERDTAVGRALLPLRRGDEGREPAGRGHLRSLHRA